VGLFHVSSRLNRESITEHGLDWRLMSDAPGIAGSTAPEIEGIFLCTDVGEADYFVRLNNTGGPVDVWQVDGVEVEQLLDAGSGYWYLPRPVPPASVRLTVLAPLPAFEEVTFEGPSDAYTCVPTITFRDQQAQPGE
jgi:hypothetical protein